MGKGWNRGDYCTCFPDNLFGIDYSIDCYEHDLDYSSKRKITRKQADLKLKKAVQEKFMKRNKKVSGWIISNLMYVGARLFGGLYWKKW